MSAAEERLTEDTLFLGVPMEAVGINVIVSGIAFLAGHSLLYLLIAPALHLVLQAICKSDHNAFRVLWMFVETKGRARNGAVWGGSSATPLPLQRWFRPREVEHG